MYARTSPQQRFIVLAFSASLGIAAPNASADDAIYNVGVAAVDVTPSYPVRLNGFGIRRMESEGIDHRIWAKAIAVSDAADDPFILITLDSCGIRLPMVDELAERLAKKADVKRARVVVAFSHSHTTPVVQGACETIFNTPLPPAHQEHVARYTSELLDALERVALDALADRQPARLFRAVGKVGFAKNRRREGGPVDHSLPMLVVKSADRDAIRAVYVTYACHCVTLGINKISGDWAGYAQMAIERNHPGARALVSIGCGSDANPESDVVENPAVAAEQGDQIAIEVDRLLKTTLRQITGSIAADYATITLPLQDPPTREELTALAAVNDGAGYNARYQLEILDRGEPLLTALRYPIQSLRFGDSLLMVFLGGEICADYAISLRTKVDPDRLWVHGYSNDFCSYIPSERLLREGGYGGGAETIYFALPNKLKPGLEKLIIDEAVRQATPSFQLATTEKYPLPPADSLARISARDEHQVELVASEPLVEDPVAIDFGLDGALWVAETPDYTRELNDQPIRGGFVKRLTDADQDGVYDTATLFASELRFPFEVKVWRNGVIVCDAPEVIFFEDTDGDGQADVRKVLFSGFGDVNAQARVNSLRWGLDGWLYGSCGMHGGTIKSFNGSEVALGDRDFRCHPDTGEIEAVTGRTQQGRACDAAGNWFGCDSGTPIRHYPLTEKYLARNPYVTPPSPHANIVDEAQMFPIGEPTILTLSGPPGRPTSVCGLEIYRDDYLGPQFTGNSFVAEPVNQLVHRRTLTADGITFRSRRAEDEVGREFLASRDQWFRPVQVRTGLDGCLWIVDMHRAVIEHPRWIEPEVLKQSDPLAGHNVGRIYRVRRRDVEPRKVIDFSQAPVDELVKMLDSPNGPQRDFAQQIILQRSSKDAVAPLKQLLKRATSEVGRAYAISTLDCLNAISDDVALQTLADPSALVRRHAIRVSETLLANSPKVASRVTELAEKGNGPVALQAVYSLGYLSNDAAAAGLASAAKNNAADPFFVTAIESSLTGENCTSVFEQLVHCADEEPSLGAVVERFASQVARLASPTELPRTFELIATQSDKTPSWRVRAAAKFLTSLSAEARADLFATTTVSKSRPSLSSTARSSLTEDGTSADHKIASLLFLGAIADHESRIVDTAAALLSARQSPAVQKAAIDYLLEANTEHAGAQLLAKWPELTTELRGEVIDGWLAGHAGVERLLAALEAARIQPSQFSAIHRERLLKYPQSDFQQRAAAAFGGAVNADRQRVVEQYLKAEELTGDAARGQQLFATHCGACHRYGDARAAVGPDLAGLTNPTPAALIQSIFNPNLAVDERYVTYIAIGEDGLARTGVLGDETSASITLLEQQGKQHILRRDEIEHFECTGRSLMPEGLEKDLSVQAVADVIAFLTARDKPAQAAADATPSAAVQPTTPDAAREIAKLLDGLAVGNEAEYERIHPIWENAIAAGRRNKEGELKALFELALPAAGKPLEDWQSVVVGGGIVNGLTQRNVWPAARIKRLLEDDPSLQARWENCLQAAVGMVHDEQTRIGTRYDALRILGAGTYDQSGPELINFLAADAHPELQMGAVSGLGDIDDQRAATALITAFAGLTERNRDVAFAALIRSHERINYFLLALESSTLSAALLTDAQLERLTAGGDPGQAARAMAFLREPTSAVASP